MPILQSVTGKMPILQRARCPFYKTIKILKIIQILPFIPLLSKAKI
ncbi:hypothetical protein BJP36_36260 [Moorena producens JHB]|uniref:Uncharacterized protein n=1 Tax=Moorena producens (strain JHB) TaxID=1454205 RepID=A0A9Q9UWV4_MOOP1|nr:hypothetical protein [Moorena producens]WAN70279.1 hypothetical protein BJP36_36260 [Moorena producens JHB]